MLDYVKLHDFNFNGHWPMSRRRCEIGGKFLSDPKDNLSLPIPRLRCRGGMLRLLFLPTGTLPRRHLRDRAVTTEESFCRKSHLQLSIPHLSPSERNNLS